MDPVQDNPQSQTDNGGSAGAGQGAQTPDYLSVMSGASGKGPETKPAEGNTGKKAEGSESTKADEVKNPAWMSQLPGDMLQNSELVKQLGKFSKIGDLAKSYSELESKLGKSLTLPGEDASDEEKAAFYGKLGKPSDVKGYGLPEDDSFNFAKLAYDNNLTTSQAKAMYEAMSKAGQAALDSQVEAQTAQAKATDEALRKEYGSKYNEKVSFMQRGLQNFGGASLYDTLQKSGALYSQDVAELFIKLGEMTSESESTIRGAAGGKTQYVSTDEGGSFTFKGLK